MFILSSTVVFTDSTEIGGLARAAHPLVTTVLVHAAEHKNSRRLIQLSSGGVCVCFVDLTIKINPLLFSVHVEGA